MIDPLNLKFIILLNLYKESVEAYQNANSSTDADLIVKACDNYSKQNKAMNDFVAELIRNQER